MQRKKKKGGDIYKQHHQQATGFSKYDEVGNVDQASEQVKSLQHRNNSECPAFAGSTMARRETRTTNIEKTKQPVQMAIVHNDTTLR